MKVYIYKHKDKEFQDDWLFTADMGFKKLGAKILYFEDIDTIPYAPDNIVIGYIEDTQYYLDKNKGYIPRPMNIPDCLSRPSFTGRKMERFINLQDVEKFTEIQGWEKVFIKPADITKHFSSGVIKPSNIKTMIPISSGIGGATEIPGVKPIGSTTKVFISEVIDIFSEYRCFIHDHKLIGIQWYSGDILKFPSADKILNFIDKMKHWEHCPIAYTLDVGIIKSKTFENNDSPESDDRTIVIECNDAWSIGHYGLDSVLYAKILRDRWFQLTGYRK